MAISMSGQASRRISHGLSKARFAVSALLLAPALSGCILGTERPDLNLEVPATYREGGHSAPDAHLPAVDWWRGFRSGSPEAVSVRKVRLMLQCGLVAWPLLRG